MATVAPTRSPARAPLATGAALGACCVGLALWNPGDDGIPLCPTKAISGLDCPLCGGLRAVAQLTRGHPLVAADHNVVVALLAPLAVLWWLAWWWAERHDRPAPRLQVPRWGWAVIAVVAVAFTVVRNLPAAGLPRWLASTAST